jgi:hypothetical protein
MRTFLEFAAMKSITVVSRGFSFFRHYTSLTISFFCGSTAPAMTYVNLFLFSRFLCVFLHREVAQQELVHYCPRLEPLCTMVAPACSTAHHRQNDASILLHSGSIVGSIMKCGCSIFFFAPPHPSILNHVAPYCSTLLHVASLVSLRKMEPPTQPPALIVFDPTAMELYPEDDGDNLRPPQDFFSRKESSQHTHALCRCVE